MRDEGARETEGTARERLLSERAGVYVLRESGVRRVIEGRGAMRSEEGDEDVMVV